MIESEEKLHNCQLTTHRSNRYWSHCTLYNMIHHSQSCSLWYYSELTAVALMLASLCTKSCTISTVPLAAAQERGDTSRVLSPPHSMYWLTLARCEIRSTTSSLTLRSTAASIGVRPSCITNTHSYTHTHTHGPYVPTYKCG